jgi:predicted GIY-YIG superfamily endonuclease
MRDHLYFTYIVASKTRTLYTGITSDLRHRIFEHKTKVNEGFTSRYNCNRLVWFEQFNDVNVAIQREKIGILQLTATPHPSQPRAAQMHVPTFADRLCHHTTRS